MVKKLLLLWALTVMNANYCISQNKGYVAISIGPSIPIGDFASKDGANDSAGFAKTGAIFDISFAYKLGKNLGISALLRGQSNSFDNSAFASELAKQVGGSWTVDSESWKIGGLMVGGYGSYPISSKVSFDLKAMIGFLRASSPELFVTLDGSGGSVWVKQESKSATSFSYLISTGFKFDVGKKIYLLTNLDYLGSKPEFSNVVVTNSSGSNPTKNTWSQNFGTLNLGIGVGLKI
ncbi:MAG: hypothetical protein JST78_02710 [Bacteroidetes bacterium]|nr:hypothetical protein [Bacteroidota bacterium]